MPGFLITSRKHRGLAWNQWTSGIALALLAACAASETPPVKPVAAEKAVADTASLHAQIRQEIGDAACTANEQCRTLAVGHKACGGPEAYVAWSSAASDGQRLKSLAEAYAKARRDEAQKSGRMSDCSLVGDPGARCEAGRCVSASRSSAVAQ